MLKRLLLRLTLATPFWAWQTVVYVLGALFVWPWFVYLALFTLLMVFLGLLSYAALALYGCTPLPTPIARALGRDKRR